MPRRNEQSPTVRCPCLCPGSECCLLRYFLLFRSSNYLCCFTWRRSVKEVLSQAHMTRHCARDRIWIDISWVSIADQSAAQLSGFQEALEGESDDSGLHLPVELPLISRSCRVCRLQPLEVSETIIGRTQTWALFRPPRDILQIAQPPATFKTGLKLTPNPTTSQRNAVIIQRRLET